MACEMDEYKAGFTTFMGITRLAAAFVQPVLSKTATPDATDSRAPSDQSKEKRAVTLDEVAQHSTADDCWVVIHNKVYDVTKFAPKHPGGHVIYSYAGQDATDVFTAFHAQDTWNHLGDLHIGNIKAGATVAAPKSTKPTFEEDFRILRRSLQQQGMFECSAAFYVRVLLSTMGLLAAAMATLPWAASNMFALFASASMLGLFWQQCGWLSHDIVHHQVFKNRALNNTTGLFFGPICQGFAVCWWKTKHNQHHATPNGISEETFSPTDPDIDTLPFLLWDAKILQSAGPVSPALRAFLRYQHYALIPLLFVARLSWALFSAIFAFSNKSATGMKESALIVLHYAWVIGALYAGLKSWALVAVYWFVAQAMGGLFLGLVFVQSHSGMETTGKDTGFAKAQILSTRNVSRGLVYDWFFGGLNYQIEHHLFPTMPRHNLTKVQPLIAELCERHNLPYYMDSLWVCTTAVLRHLAQVGAQV